MTDEQLEEIVQRLEGQCMVGLDQAFEEAGVAMFSENMAKVEERIFQCDQCGWWHSTDELNNETEQDLCDQCAAENHDGE